MFTTVDKAIAAIISGIITVLAMVFNVEVGIGPEAIAAAGTVLSTILVYLVPNKPAAPAPTEPVDPPV